MGRDADIQWGECGLNRRGQGLVRKGRWYKGLDIGFAKARIARLRYWDRV